MKLTYLLFIAFLIFLTGCASTVKLDSSTPLDYIIDSANQKIMITENSAHITVDIKINIFSKGELSPILLQTIPVQIRDFRITPEGGHILKSREGIKFIADKAQKYEITYDFEIPYNKLERLNSVSIPVIHGMRKFSEIVLPQDKIDFKMHPNGIILDSYSKNGKSFVHFIPPDIDSVTLFWSLQEQKVPSNELSVNESSIFTVLNGIVKRNTTFVFNSLNELPSSLTLITSKNFVLTKITGDFLKGYTTVELEECRKIVLYLTNAHTNTMTIKLWGEERCDFPPSSAFIKSILVLEAKSHKGHCSLLRDESLEVRIMKADYLEHSTDSKIIPQKSGYLLVNNFCISDKNYNLECVINTIKPEIEAVGKTIAFLQTGELIGKIKINLTVNNSPLNDITLLLGTDISVENFDRDKIKSVIEENGKLRIIFKSIISSDCAFEIVFRKKITGSDKTLIPIPFTAGAVKQRYWVGFDVSKELDVIDIETKNLTQTNVFEKEEHSVKWFYSGSIKDASVQVQVQPTKLECTADLTQFFVFQNGVLIRNTDAKISVKRGRLKNLQIKIPAGEEVLSVLNNEIAKWHFDASSRTLNIFFTSTVVKSTVVSISTQKFYDRNTNIFTLEPYNFYDTKQTKTKFGITTEFGKDLELISLENLEDIPPQSLSKEELKWAYRSVTSDWSLSFKTKEIPVEIDFYPEHFVTIFDGFIEHHINAAVVINKNKTKEITIVLPKNCSGVNLTFTGLSSHSGISAISTVGERIEVIFKNAIFGTFNLFLTYREITEKETITINPVKLEGSKNSKGQITLLHGDKRIEVQIDEIKGGRINQIITIDTIPANLHSFPPLFQFQYYTQNDFFNIKTVSNIEPDDLLPKFVLTELVSIIKKDGELITYFGCIVEVPKGQQFIRMNPQNEVTVWAAYVEGKPVKTLLEKDGTILIPIRNSTYKKVILALEMIWIEKHNFAKTFSTTSINMPKFKAKIHSVDWKVYVPQGFSIFSESTNMMRGKEFEKMETPSVVAKVFYLAKDTIEPAKLFLSKNSGIVIVITLIVGLFFFIIRGIKKSKPSYIYSSIAIFLFAIVIFLVLQPWTVRTREADKYIVNTNISKKISSSENYIETDQSDYKSEEISQYYLFNTMGRKQAQLEKQREIISKKKNFATDITMDDRFEKEYKELNEMLESEIRQSYSSSMSDEDTGTSPKPKALNSGVYPVGLEFPTIPGAAINYQKMIAGNESIYIKMTFSNDDVSLALQVVMIFVAFIFFVLFIRRYQILIYSLTMFAMIIVLIMNLGKGFAYYGILESLTWVLLICTFVHLIKEFSKKIIFRRINL